MHRSWIRYFNAPEGGDTGAGAGASGNDDSKGAASETPSTFTQADVDRIVKDRLDRVKAKYSDYDDLKAKAEGSKTVEDRLAEMEKRATGAEARALRNDIATRHGISAEDRDLFLTGTDEETLAAQAKRLAQREADRKKQGNVARKEGGSPNPGSSKSDLREYTRQLFGEAD